SNYVYGQRPQDLSPLILTDRWTKKGVEGKYGNIIESRERLSRDELKEGLDMIRSDHQIQRVLTKWSSDSNRSYDKEGDRILTGTDDIKVKMSAAMSMYEEGQSLLEDKEEEIKKLEAAVEREIKDYYQRKKREVQRKIDDIEAEPKAYSFLLTKHLPILGMNKEIKHIHVNEEFESLKHADMEDYIDKLNNSVETGNDYIESYRKSVEDLFDEEENVAAMFDFAEEVLS